MLVVFMIYNVSMAQDQPTVTLADLQVPDSPAFVLLDVASSSIEKPTTTKELSTSLINALNSGNGIPKNYAVEFTPFWFFKYSDMNIYKYWGIDKKTLQQDYISSAKMLSISFAIVNNTTSTASSSTTQNAALGIKSNFFKVRDENDIHSLITVDDKVMSLIDTAVNKAENSISPNDASYPEKVSEAVQTELNNLATTNEYIAANKELNEILNRNPLFSVDVAAAIDYAISNNNITDCKFGKSGAWLDAAYSYSLDGTNSESKTNYINVILTGRYLYDNTLITSLNNVFDSGGKLEFQFEKVILSYEYLYRYNFTDKSQCSFRSDGSIKYEISDSVYLTTVLGKNFGSINNLMTSIALNIGLGSGNEKMATK